jgi:hypothetical protein
LSNSHLQHDSLAIHTVVIITFSSGDDHEGGS